MDTASLTWTDAGLAYFDIDGGYLLNDRLHATTDPHPDRQEAQFTMPDETTVALFNDGFEDDGAYTELVTAITGDTSTTHEVEGMNWVAARCGDRVFGISEATGPHALPSDEPGGPSRLFLRQLYPAVDRDAPPAALTTPVTLAGFAPDAPCVDGVIHYLGYQDESTPVLAQWDTIHNRFTTTPLTDPAGQPLFADATDDVIGPWSMNSHSWRDDRLVWFGGDGIVRSTDPTTGITTDRFPTRGDVRLYAQITPLFTQNWLYVLDAPADLNAPIGLWRYDLDTGDETPLLTIDDLNTIRGQNLVIRGTAIAPTHQ
ncbi:hypothetical protein [Microbacterium sp.]|uniref:hypothetical protein n=1 Tax=Microbacterium sp. TaxID=51671 RepID=UPI003A83ADED